MARRRDPKKEDLFNPYYSPYLIGASALKSRRAEPHEILGTQLRGALTRAKGTEGGRQISTILGEDFEHVFKEKDRLRRQAAANPLAAAAVFDNVKPFLGSRGFTETLGIFKSLADQAASGTLSEQQKQFLEDQTRFSNDQGKFTSLLGRRDEVVKQRELVEAARKRSPGRTQTILTRRES